MFVSKDNSTSRGKDTVQWPDHWTQERVWDELFKMCSKIHATDDVKQTAKLICSQVFSLGLNRRRTTLSIIASALFLALREKGEAVTLREFASEINASPQQMWEIARYYRALFNELNPRLPTVDPSAFVQGIAERAKRSRATTDLALELLDKIKQTKPEISGRNPLAVAAAAVYMASMKNGEKISEREISSVAGVTEACIRKSIRKFR